MNTIGIILLVAFVVVCILLVLLVLVQDDGQNGMGGLLGGRGMSAFGSHSASVLTKSTTVFVILFFVIAFSLALVNRKPKLPETLNDTAAPESATTEPAETETTKEDTWWATQGSKDESAAPLESNSTPAEDQTSDNSATEETTKKETEEPKNVESSAPNTEKVENEPQEAAPDNVDLSVLNTQIQQG